MEFSLRGSSNNEFKLAWKEKIKIGFLSNGFFMPQALLKEKKMCVKPVLHKIKIILKL